MLSLEELGAAPASQQSRPRGPSNAGVTPARAVQLAVRPATGCEGPTQGPEVGSRALEASENTPAARPRPVIAFDPWDSDDSEHVSVPATVGAGCPATEQPSSTGVTNDSVVDASVVLGNPMLDHGYNLGLHTDSISELQLDTRPAAESQLRGLPSPAGDITPMRPGHVHSTTRQRPGSGADSDDTCQPTPGGTLASGAAPAAAVVRQDRVGCQITSPEPARSSRAVQESMTEAGSRHGGRVPDPDVAPPRSPPQSSQLADTSRPSGALSAGGSPSRQRVFRSKLEFQAAWELECWKQGEMNAFLARLQVLHLARGRGVAHRCLRRFIAPGKYLEDSKWTKGAECDSMLERSDAAEDF